MKNKIIQNWLLQNKLNTILTIDDLIKINKEDLIKILIKNDKIKLFNFIITVQFLYDNINFNEINPIEEKIFESMTEIEKNTTILLNCTQVLSAVINESLREDWDFILDEKLWIGVNLDSFYKAKLKHMTFDDTLLNTLKPRSFKKNKKLTIDIIKRNVIISTIHRINEIIIYNRVNDKPVKIIDEIAHLKFTKGYMICIPPVLTEKLKKYIYDRKLPLSTPLNIKTTQIIKNIYEYYKNNSYSSPIWLNEQNLDKVHGLSNKKIYGLAHTQEIPKTDNLVHALNFLNSIEFTVDKTLLNDIINFLNNKNVGKSLTTKKYIINKLLIIDEQKHNWTNQGYINAASTIELIKKQAERFPSFFFNHKLDNRTRVYVNQWPLNYQLSHIVRICLKEYKVTNVIKIWNNFINSEEIHNITKNTKFLIQHSLTENLLNKITKIIEKDTMAHIKQNNVLKTLIIEAMIITLSKLCPKRIRKYEDKLEWSLLIYDKLINDNIFTNSDLWCNKLEIPQKKIIYIYSLQKTLKKITNNQFDDMFWGDASSNAIQLLVIRLGLFDEKLLMLTNIIDNETEWSNIYNYITVKIKLSNHEEIAKNLNITVEDIINFQNDEINKFLIMPSSYGMGKYSYRENVDKILSENNNEAWLKILDIKTKNKISDYFWKLAWEFLNEIGFNMNLYKNKCKDLWKDDKYDAFVWKNDCENLIAPISLKKSKRQKIKEELEKLKLKKNNILDKIKINEIEKKIKKIKIKINKDERMFWKRTMVKVKNNKIYSRITYEPNVINKHDTRNAIIPNTIHATDAAVLNIVIEKCSKLNINITTIHDSIGCNILLAPAIKILFKIAYIQLLEINTNKEVFPLDKPIKIKDKNKLYKQIIESKDFFR